MRFVGALLLSILLSFNTAALAETIRVAAAISLKDAITEIANVHEAATGDTVELVFGSSGQLMAQIRNGAETDLFISAANRQVDELQAQQLIDAGSRRVVVRNGLVLIVPGNAKTTLDRFQGLTDPSVQRVAVGEPKTVPAGQYAQQVLQSLNLAETLEAKLIYGANVRQVLAYVERGEVSAGIVYATDAREAGERVRVVAIADDDWHESIVYPAAIVSASRRKEAAGRFLAFLSQADARAVFSAKGFITDEPATTQPTAP